MISPDRSTRLPTQRLFDELRDKLQLEWIAGHTGAGRLVAGAPDATRQALVGGLNWIHPNRIQVIGQSELDYLNKLKRHSFEDAVTNLFAARPAAVLFSHHISADLPFVDAAEATETPLLCSPLPYDQLIFELQYYLTNTLAEPTTVHGVFMEVLGMGVLVTGAAAIGKSELALELITRGHRLIADDAPMFARIAPDIINGTCPPMLYEFLEVRGLGILNIRAMFGDSAIKQSRYLRLIVQLERLDRTRLADLDRLEGSRSDYELLGVRIPRITLPVAPGRSLAILVEAAVRDHLLRRKGYSASDDFVARQEQALG